MEVIEYQSWTQYSGKFIDQIWTNYHSESILSWNILRNKPGLNTGE